ncbi:MAG: dihydrofolate reductase family protein [Pseudonocardiales bacterium]|nr:dihydrofolate reductase family protein [Pseudonocardiales bacterium]MBV9029545.1 dihydrofolate reductase family protein [Pseudonocardiales bacterium]
MDEPLVMLRRLLPEPGGVTAVEALDGLALADLAPGHRPYLVLNMVATADGAAAVAHRTAPISSPADRQLFHELRAHVDAVMVGAGTVRTERYGRLVRDPQRRERRVARGLAPEPLAVIVSRRLMLTPDLPLLADPHSRVVVLTAGDAKLAECAADVSYLRSAPGEEVDLSAMLARLRTEHGVRSVLCEGGPNLNTSLLPAGLVDELFLSITPALAGSAGSRSIVDRAPLAEPVGLELVGLLESGSQLFARYALQR